MIVADRLTKRFGKTCALNGVSLRMQRGKITAVAGPNGSGKTTLIKTILGMVKPSGGSIMLNGTELNGQCAYRSEIGYMPQLGHFPENLKVVEVLKLIGSLRGGNDWLDNKLLIQFELDRELNKKVSSLSGGTRQKLNA